jgi:hypothetical protein
MQLTVNKKQLAEAPEIWLRRAGYGLIPDREAGQPSFARRLTRDFYPRFHIYFTVAAGKSGEEMITFNLHLDQKRPGYAGYNRHNAEYDGEVVEREMKRLENFIRPSFFV